MSAVDALDFIGQNTPAFSYRPTPPVKPDAVTQQFRRKDTAPHSSPAGPSALLVSLLYLVLRRFLDLRCIRTSVDFSIGQISPMVSDLIASVVRMADDASNTLPLS